MSNEYQAPTPRDPKPRSGDLTPKEIRQLHSLSYRNEHISRLSVDRAREIIDNGLYREGSAAYAKHAINPLTGTPGIPEIEKFTDEAIEARNAVRPTPSGVAVTLDEFTNQCLAGDDPLDAVLLAHEDRFPGMRFRLFNPDLPSYAGPQFQPVYDAEGKQIKAGGLDLRFMPEDVYQQAFVEPNKKRAKQQTQEVRSKLAQAGESGGNLSDGMDKYAPLNQDELRVETSKYSSR